MSNAALEKIEEIFGGLDKFTPENLESLIHEVFKFFNELKIKLESSDPKEREEALQIASTLRTKLEDQANKLCESIGMDPKALETYLGSPANFSQEEWKAMEKAKTDLDRYKEDLLKTDTKTTRLATAKVSGKKKPKAIKEWIAG